MTCIPSGRTQRAAGWSRLSAAQTAAMTSRHRLGQLDRDEQPHPSSSQRPPQQVEGEVGGELPHHRAVAGEAVLGVPRPAGVATAMCTVPTGFSSLPPPGPGDPGDGEAALGAQRPGARRHRLRDLAAHRAVRREQRPRHAEQPLA